MIYVVMHSTLTEGCFLCVLKLYQVVCYTICIICDIVIHSTLLNLENYF